MMSGAGVAISVSAPTVIAAIAVAKEAPRYREQSLRTLRASEQWLAAFMVLWVAG